MTIRERPGQVNLRLTIAEKAALEELARRRGVEVGDDTVTGWFRAVLRREARAAGVPIEGAVTAVAIREETGGLVKNKPARRGAKR